jgi:hypothetical protein
LGENEEEDEGALFTLRIHAYVIRCFNGFIC